MTYCLPFIDLLKPYWTKENSNLEFDLEFEVRPEIKMPKYKNKVTIKTNKYLAGDKDLEDSIKDLQTRFREILLTREN